MFPMQGDVGPIAVEYDAGGERVRKTFDDVFEARRFYTRMFFAGRRPRVVKPDANAPADQAG